jgi:membrane protein
LVGSTGAKTIQDMAAHSQNRSSGIIASVIGLGALLFGATGLFAELKSSLDTIWGVEPKPDNGIWQTIRERFLSSTMVLGIGFLLLVSLVISAGLSAFGKQLAVLLPGMNIMVVAADLLISLRVITLLFAMIFKVLPDVKIT